MAIQENETSNYFKVDLTKSFVQKNMVFASITVYGSERDRELEKTRFNSFLLFDENCQAMLQNLSTDEYNEEIYTSFSHAIRYIKDRRYANNKLSINNIVFPEEIIHLLLECGYQSEWIRSPIFIVAERLINCGSFNADILSVEYIYYKLKTKMALDIRDI